MKALLIAGGVVLGLVLGFWPGGLSGTKPVWWRLLASIASLALVALVFSIPSGSDVGSAKLVAMNRGDDALIPVLGRVVELPSATQPNLVIEGYATGRHDSLIREAVTIDDAILSERLPAVGDEIVIEATFDRVGTIFHGTRVISVNPWVTIPLNPQLEEQARNLYFHVPAAWLATLAWFVAAAYGIVYLRKRRPEDDIRASSTAAVGLLFCVLATVTGSFWAWLQWGVPWNWDPRQVSIFATLVIFAAYFALRSALSDEELRARISSIYLVMLALPVLFFVFVYPRLESGLHPGSQGSDNSGPVISPQADALPTVKQALYGLAMLAFSMLFFWMVNLSVRSRFAERRLRQRAFDQESEGRGPTATLRAIDADAVRQP